MATPSQAPIPTPTTTPDSSSPGTLQNLLSPGARAAIAVSIVIVITILAILCWCCCCRHSSSSSSSSKRSLRGRQSTLSGHDSQTPTSELGFVHDPTSMIEMDASGRGVGVEEPPPPYYTLEHRHSLPLRPSRAVSRPVEMAGRESGVAEGMEAWNGEEVAEEMTPGRNPWMVEHEVPIAEPSTRRNTSLRVNTDIRPVIHVTDENGGSEDADLSRSITYSTYSEREAAVGTVVIPSVVNRDGSRNQRKL